jgi:hypothetical protein
VALAPGWFVYENPRKITKPLFGREVTEERKAQQKTRDAAKFPEENPNPVLRVSDTGEVLYANAAARMLTELLTNDGSRLTTDLGRAVDAVYNSQKSRDVECASPAKQLTTTSPDRVTPRAPICFLDAAQPDI